MEKFNYADVDFPPSSPLAGRLKVSLKKPRNRNPPPKRDRGNGRGGGNPGPNKKRKVRNHTLPHFLSPCCYWTKYPTEGCPQQKDGSLTVRPSKGLLKS